LFREENKVDGDSEERGFAEEQDEEEEEEQES
jgi:hypothetical protein